MQKAHVSQKIVLYFKGVTVNTENYSQRSHSLHLRDKWHKQFSTSQKEKPIRKKKKAKSSVGRSSEKSHNINKKFHFREVTITSKDYKIFLYIKLQLAKSYSTSKKKKKNYNQQSRSSHRPTPSQGKKPQEREREGKGEGEREIKEEREKEGEGERQKGG